ncbi:MAG: MarR family winged helix-turn-helix transcriptional regulator [Actinomadura sp.]
MDDMDRTPDEKRRPVLPDPFLRLPSYLVAELARLARRTSLGLFPGERLRLGHTAVLACIADQGPLCQREVSESLRFDPADVVGIVDTLENLGYLVRGRDQRDRRRYSVEITATGRTALRESRDQMQRLNEVLFAPLTPAETDRLRSLLVRVLAHHDPRFADDARADGVRR